MSKNIRIVPTQLVCMNCGNVEVIQRRIGRLKKIGHIKHFYCSKCCLIEPHYEVREVNSFIWECMNKNILCLDDNTEGIHKKILTKE